MRLLWHTAKEKCFYASLELRFHIINKYEMKIVQYWEICGKWKGNNNNTKKFINFFIISIQLMTIFL